MDCDTEMGKNVFVWPLRKFQHHVFTKPLTNSSPQTSSSQKVVSERKENWKCSDYCIMNLVNFKKGCNNSQYNIEPSWRVVLKVSITGFCVLYFSLNWKKERIGKRTERRTNKKWKRSTRKSKGGKAPCGIVAFICHLTAHKLATDSMFRALIM